jgi:hypothetical protein
VAFFTTINIAMETLYRYYAYTLIDITETKVLTQSAEQQKQRNQQRNWETINQLLSLRAQLMEFNYLPAVTDDVAEYSFGINYTGLHKIWSFDFAVEREDVYAFNHDRYGILKDDFKLAPIILGLDETAHPTLPLFYASGVDKNIYFKTRS